MERKTDLRILLDYINPAACSYQEWVNVGMALKEEGYSASDWEAWSLRDSARFHKGECARKWDTFQGAASPVTGGTIYQMAVEGGYAPDKGYELDWDSTIEEDGIVVDKNWLEGQELRPLDDWHPARQLSDYLQALFEPGETVGFVSKSWKNEKGRYVPKDKGVYNKTAGQLIEELAKCGDDIGAVVGDYDPEAGAWIRFNPLDGQGVKNANVAEFRYALVESDNMDIEKQYAIIKEMELPVAALVFSGGKSLHAIVRVEAVDYAEYRKRVDYLYSVCEKNGMTIDTQNRNPSRLSRMPGCMRGSNRQYIVETNIGRNSWTDWFEWIESVNDNLPDVDGLAGEWDNMPELSPPLISDVLRQGHKMLIAGPSKAGKSYLLIELVIAIAEGRKWLNWGCTQGRVLYVNLELDRASCLHRFRDVYTALGWEPRGLRNIDIWNLRGRSVPMDKLAPKLVRRAQKKGYSAIVIDPIYKVITGDENSADQMARFCNQFDLVCTELDCAVIYCHHHSKGAQGDKKAQDRASGSGVFARDPDAVLDMIELEPSEEMMKQQVNKAVCNVCRTYLDAHWNWKDDLSPDDLLSSTRLLAYCGNVLQKWQYETELMPIVEEAEKTATVMTAWRIEGVLREFPRFLPVNLWFRHPVHYIDASGGLADISPDVGTPAWQKMIDKRKAQTKEHNANQLNAMIIAFEGLKKDGAAVLEDVANQIGVAEGTIKKWLGDGKNQSKSKFKEMFSYYKNNKDGKIYLTRNQTGHEREIDDKSQ